MRNINYSNFNYQVAGLLFQVLLPVSYDELALLPTFQVFKREEDTQNVEGVIFRLKVVTETLCFDDSAVLLSQDFGVFGNTCNLFEYDDFYLIEVAYAQGGSLHQMCISRKFDSAEAFIDFSDCYAKDAISFFLMFAFAQRSIYYNTFLLHASVVIQSEQGFAFLGKSGTGKSTHTSLWLENISGSTLLNDDNPAVSYCVDTDQVWISGTPWSGKTPCYKDQIVKLGALIRLEQAPFNRFVWLEESYALISVLPGCSSLRWNYEHYMRLCNLLEMIIKKTPVGHLLCRADKYATELCYKEIKYNKNNDKV